MTPELVGGKVRLRDRKTMDLVRESLWTADPEVAVLDPAVGVLHNNQQFAIETLEGVHIGRCSVYNFDHQWGQLGIKIGDKNYWSKGYGTDAMKLLISYCLTTLGIQHLWLKVLPENTRAQRCYEKCGFAYSGKAIIDEYEFIIMERDKDG